MPKENNYYTTCILNNKVFCKRILSFEANYLPMKNIFTLLAALFILVMATSCGRTIYRSKVYKSDKYLKHKSRYHFWHAHGARPRAHHGGYW